jgi:hypothetical protein
MVLDERWVCQFFTLGPQIQMKNRKSNIQVQLVMNLSYLPPYYGRLLDLSLSAEDYLPYLDELKRNDLILVDPPPEGGWAEPSAPDPRPRP